MKSLKRYKDYLITFGIVVVFYAIMQILGASGSLSNQIKGLLVPICIYTIMAVSLNLTVGILGELSLGHAGFMCVGAFASSLFSMCMKDTGMNPLVRFIIAIVIGAIVAAIFGILIGIPVLRLKGDYLAIVTLAFGEIIKNVINVFYIGRDENGFHFSDKDAISLGLSDGGKKIMEGPQGITGTPNDSTFTIGIILLIITLFVVLNFKNSRSGRAVMSIRDNRIAAESVGINISKYKLMAFAISASFAGVAGALYAHNYSTLQATKFNYNLSIMVLVYVVLGGIGNIRGSVIAATILTVLPELLRSFSEYRMLIYAVVLIVMMIFNASPKAIEWRKKYPIKGMLGKFFSKNKKEVE